MEENALKKAVDSLKIRFPIADMERDLGFAKGQISQYYNGIKRPSRNFIETFEKHYGIKIEDFESDSTKMKKKRVMESLSDFSDYEIVEYIGKNIDRFKDLAVFKVVVGIKRLEELEDKVKLLEQKKGV